MAHTQPPITELLDLSNMSEEQLAELATNATNLLANIRMKKTQLVRDRIATIDADIHTLAAEITELKATQQIVLQKIQSQTNKRHELELSIATTNKCNVHTFEKHMYFCVHSLEFQSVTRCIDCLAYRDFGYCTWELERYININQLVHL